jgi:enoyl-CoA hydratase
MTLINLEVKDKIALLTLNRPEALNALNSDLLGELHAQLKQLEEEEDLRCLIVTGSGEKAFAAGADISEMAEMDPDQAEEFSSCGQKVFTCLATFPCPVIAAIHGYALGGGFELALACDIRIAADTARFSFPETGLGIMPGFGGTQRLARLTQAAYAMELIFTGRRIKGEEALEKGVINRLVPAAELMDEALKMAESIAAKAPLGIRMAKEAMRLGLDLELESGLQVEAELFARCFASSDQKEAMRSFLKK